MQPYRLGSVSADFFFPPDELSVVLLDHALPSLTLEMRTSMASNIRATVACARCHAPEIALVVRTEHLCRCV